MTRPTMVAGLSIASALLCPTTASAQSPLAIYCNSPTQEYCMSILTWEYSLRLFDENPDVVQAQFLSKVQLYGSAFEQGGPDRVGIDFTLTPDEWRIRGYAYAMVDGPGYYTFVESTPGSRTYPGEVGPSTPQEDLVYMVFGDDAGCSLPGHGNLFSTCVQVPEPATWLLLVGGLPAIVAMRRKRAPHLHA